jgi:hypothetical protein
MSELGGIPSWAVRGAKVVCIKVGAWSPSDGLDDEAKNHPILDGIYTIDMAVTDERGEPFITLDEFWPFDLYALASFRPLVTRSAEEDLAIFAPMLGARQPELERA